MTTLLLIALIRARRKHDGTWPEFLRLMIRRG